MQYNFAIYGSQSLILLKYVDGGLGDSMGVKPECFLVLLGWRSGRRQATSLLSCRHPPTLGEAGGMLPQK